jgi:hypothetical protein
MADESTAGAGEVVSIGALDAGEARGRQRSSWSGSRGGSIDMKG